MGRKPTVHADNMYNLASTSIAGMDVGDLRIIDIPNDIIFFRKYLSEIAKREGKKFTTKSIDSKLHIMRVKYSNIYSKELE